MNLDIKSKSFTPSENQEWLASRLGTQEANSITLDRALCVASFPTGVVPSGIPLGVVTATGRYAPCLSTAGDGSQVCQGHLFTTIDFTSGGDQALATAPNSPAALLWIGQVILAKIPTFTNRQVLTTAANQPKLVRYV